MDLKTYTRVNLTDRGIVAGGLDLSIFTLEASGVRILP